jgi:integrase
MRDLPPGVYRDRYGLRSTVKVGTIQREKRWKPDTPIKKLTDWQDETRVALRKIPQAAGGHRGSFGADVKRYLELVKPTLTPETYNSRVCELDAYLAVFRSESRYAMTRERLLDLRTWWLTQEPGKRTGQRGVTPKTVRNREGALRHLVHTLDGKRAPTPVDDLPPLPKTPANPKFVTVATIRKVLKRLTDPQTRARFMVLVATGQRPAQLKRAQRIDVNLRRRLWMIRRAKGGHPIPLPLTTDMVAAFKALDAAEAWGDFDGSDYAKELYAAGWPKDIRPYNAKHTVAIALAEAGAEWEDIKDFFGHTDVKTTRIYTGLVAARTKGISRKLAGRLGW